MPDATRTLSSSTANLHRKMNEISDAVGKLLVDAFHLLALFAIGATTVWSAVATFIGMLTKGHANLPDILLLFKWRLGLAVDNRWPVSQPRARASGGPGSKHRSNQAFGRTPSPRGGEGGGEGVRVLSIDL